MHTFNSPYHKGSLYYCPTLSTYIYKFGTFTETVVVYYKAALGQNCFSEQMSITDVDECKVAAQSISYPFQHTINTDENEPLGCFWDYSGKTFFYNHLFPRRGFDTVGAVCKGKNNTIYILSGTEDYPIHVLINQ